MAMLNGKIAFRVAERECDWVWDHMVESFICGAIVADAVFEMDFAF